MRCSTTSMLMLKHLKGSSFLKFLKDISLFCEATDTPVLDFC